MKYSLSSKVIFPWGGAGGELGGAARTTLPRIDLGAAGKLGVAARNTLPGPGLGAAGKLGVAARNTPPGPGLGAAGYQLLPPNRNRKDVRLNRVPLWTNSNSSGC